MGLLERLRTEFFGRKSCFRSGPLNVREISSCFDYVAHVVAREAVRVEIVPTPSQD